MDAHWLVGTALTLLTIVGGLLGLMLRLTFRLGGEARLIGETQRALGKDLPAMREELAELASMRRDVVQLQSVVERLAHKIHSEYPARMTRVESSLAELRGQIDGAHRERMASFHEEE